MKIHRVGFTIVELLIVIVVIAILAVVSIVAYNGVQVRAKTRLGMPRLIKCTSSLNYIRLKMVRTLPA